MNFHIFGKDKPQRMLRTLIIDDEPHVRETLQSLLQKFCPQVKVVGEAGSVATGAREIQEKRPDLVLLDIKMDDGTGFDLLNRFEHIGFKIIFVTAWEKYAIQAFGFSAVDYLLKPVNPEKLAEAVNRAEQQVQSSFNIQLNTLKENLASPENPNRKIILKTSDNVYLVKVQDIIHCASDCNYTRFTLADGDKILVSKLLKDYDELLAGSGFFRVHRSNLINLKHIKRFEKQDGGYVVMSNGDKIPASTRGRERLMELFDELANP
jgi:two-component system, LytTR family, response regulator